MHLKATWFRLTEEPAILEGEGSVQLPQEREGNMGTALKGEGSLVCLRKQTLIIKTEYKY